MMTPSKACAIAMAEQIGQPMSVFLGNTKAHAIAHPRQIAMLAARQMSGQSMPQIARAFNRADHTTVLHALRRAEHHITSPANARLLEVCKLKARLMMQKASK